jgi:hypothetical protein
MISKFLQIKSSVESIDLDSRKVCYLCLPRSHWIVDDKEDPIENNMCEAELVIE